MQILKATYSPLEGLQPANLTAKKGKPVRVEVLAEDDGVGCMGSFAIPSFSRKVAAFKKGQTVAIEFTPQKAGSYQMTCAMGIPHGTLTVVN